MFWNPNLKLKKYLKLILCDLLEQLVQICLPIRSIIETHNLQESSNWNYMGSKHVIIFFPKMTIILFLWSIVLKPKMRYNISFHHYTSFYFP
jgi:hypothetical protein